ncbi:MAG: hypothetical protein HY731_08985 [Candidatus Tectomicrobia bacterium]|nr:hypothetical protein [Candidatus Tectomicrobia bacterium]
MGRKVKKKLEQREKSGEKPRPHPSMRRRRRKWIVGTLLALFIFGGSVGVGLWYGAKTTFEIAPRFALLASIGKTIALEDYLGKQEVILLFYMGAG